MIEVSDFLKLVGNTIRTIRKQRGLTQEELAEKADLQYSYIGGIERGERNISLLTLEKVVTSLNVSPSEIFNFNDIDIVDIDSVNQVLEIHKNVLRARDLEEIKSIHNITKEILTLVEMQKRV